MVHTVFGSERERRDAYVSFKEQFLSKETVPSSHMQSEVYG